eukprot:scaffold37721_cov231-Skeletonema_marinoi.AAC.2
MSFHASNSNNNGSIAPGAREKIATATTTTTTNPDRHPNLSSSGKTYSSAVAGTTPNYANKGTQSSKKGAPGASPSPPTKPTQSTNKVAKAVAKASATAPKVGDSRGRDNISATPPRSVVKTNPGPKTTLQNYPIFDENSTSTIGTDSSVCAGDKVPGSGKGKTSDHSTKQRFRQTLLVEGINSKGDDNDSIMDESSASGSKKQPTTNTANLQKDREDQVLDPTGSDGPGDEEVEENVSSEKASSDGEKGITAVNKPRGSANNGLSAVYQPKSPDSVNGTKQQERERLSATDKSEKQGVATASGATEDDVPPEDSSSVKPPSVRFGNASQRNFDVNATPSGNEVTPPSDLPTTGLNVSPRLQLGTIPRYKAPDGRFISVNIQHPEMQQTNNRTINVSDAVAEKKDIEGGYYTHPISFPISFGDENHSDSGNPMRMRESCSDGSLSTLTKRSVAAVTKTIGTNIKTEKKTRGREESRVLGRGMSVRIRRMSLSTRTSRAERDHAELSHVCANSFYHIPTGS